MIEEEKGICCYYFECQALSDDCITCKAPSNNSKTPFSSLTLVYKNMDKTMVITKITT